MNSKEIFEAYFKSHTGHVYSLSLLSFFKDIIRPRLNSVNLTILDLGPGNYSMFEDADIENSKIDAIDFSSFAINSAPKSRIHYIEGNISDSEFFKEEKYDLIFDSHALNCIINTKDRESVFKNIYFGLKSDGLFASELMVQPINENISMPLKMIKTSHDLEAEIIKHGFKIVYFLISKNFSFVNEMDGIEIKTDMLRIVCQK